MHMARTAFFGIFLACLLTARCGAPSGTPETVHTQESPPRLVGNCEGCEAVFEYGDQVLQATDTLPVPEQSAQVLHLSGTVFQPDGVTPAEGVILYIHHTDPTGRYPVRGDETGWGRRHGYLRGWIRTGTDGRYLFVTRRPASYPGGTGPAHIHLTVAEPDGRYYWLEEFLFEGDPLLPSPDRRTPQPRGGPGNVLTLEDKDGIAYGKRDIVLGRHVDGY